MDQEEIRSRLRVFLDKGFDYEESLKSVNIQHDDVMKLKQKLEDVPIVPILHVKLCLFFLNGSSGNIDEAAKRIEKYYQIKTTSPEFFWDRNPESMELQRSFKVYQMASLPLAPNNCFVFITRSIDSNSKNFYFDDVFKTFMMIAENELMTHGPRYGSILISDWKGVSFGHLFRPSISSIMKSLDYVQNASPLKTKAVHVLNSSRLFQTLFSMLKPFINKEVYDVIHIHTPDMDYNEFFEKHVPRHCMPSDYGGDLPSLDELHAKNIETLTSMKEYYYLEELHFKSAIEKSSI
ncbi:alpha-tocopherol transfer protein-like [Chironomus tepperi]|uniref:alpha-tocopherol transfer protein-like n=1 Tax=Chironomus tepperi TaxID=113505 RepID=UPI00391F9E82